jgi:hypothetical protein
MVGINGEKITLAVKLIKKIKTRRIKKGSWVLIAAKLASVSTPVVEFCKTGFKVKMSELGNREKFINDILRAQEQGQSCRGS